MSRVFMLEINNEPKEFWVDQEEAYKMVAAYDYPNAEVVTYIKEIS